MSCMNAQDPAKAADTLTEGLTRVAGSYRALFEGAADEHALREQNAKVLGPQGELTQLLKLMRHVDKSMRRELGQKSNKLKGEITACFDETLVAFQRRAREAELSAPHLDPTLPARGHDVGRLHPITRIKHELLDIFQSLGFDVADGPEIDLHENCFEKLGFPPDHPAADMQDTFFVKSKQAGHDVDTVLRTHTSTVQVREMLKRKPPLAIVAPGAVYRRDDDSTHSPMFFQLEGLLVDRDVTFAELKGVLTLFLQRVFGSDTEVRFRPSYFPFVEPGGEVDVRRPGGDWMEILGCGMVHPVVFENVGYDPNEWSGFAFGLGLDRIAMVKYGVPNIKALYENDVRFLSSF